MTAEGTETEPILLSRRLVAFCDIIGFTERLKTSPLQELHATYSRLIDHANSKIFQQESGVGSPHHRNFARADFLFDSVLLVSNPLDAEDGPRSVSDFMSALSQLFESSLGWQLPLWGAIGLGDVLEDSTRRISLSEIIPDLVSAEKHQEWAGVMVLASAVDAVIDGLYGTPATEIPKGGMGHVVSYAVPTKQAAVPSLVINWPYFCDTRDIQAGLAFLTGRKRDETQRFVDFVHSLLPAPARLPSRVGTIETVPTVPSRLPVGGQYQILRCGRKRRRSSGRHHHQLQHNGAPRQYPPTRGWDRLTARCSGRRLRPAAERVIVGQTTGISVQAAVTRLDRGTLKCGDIAMNLFVFSSRTLTNVWAGIGAGLWAISEQQAAMAGVQSKARNMRVARQA